MKNLLTVSLCFLTASLSAADLTTWPGQYTIRPWETARLTAADVVGPDGIVYPDFTGVGVTGGIPDVNNERIRSNYTVFDVKTYGAIGDGTTNDDAAAASALAAAKAHAVKDNKSIIYFPKGSYLLTKPLDISQNNIVFDGDGPDSTFVKIAADPSILPEATLFSFKTPGLQSGKIFATAQINRGANTATFDKDPAANGYTIGSWARLGASKFEPGTTMSDRFNNPDNHVIYADPSGQHTGRAFIAKVLAIDSATKTITFDRTVTHDFYLDEAPQIRHHAFLEHCGVQDLTIQTDQAAKLNSIRFENAANSWIYNVHVVKPRNYPLILTGVTRFEVRDSKFLGTRAPIGSGSNAYFGWISSTDSLMDNCEASDLRHMAIFQYANRSVIRRCVFSGQTVTSPQLHGRFPHENLIEDTTFQNSNGGKSPERGLSAYASDGASSLRHGVEGPRNVFYNNRVKTGAGVVEIGGMKEGLIFAYNRILKTDDQEALPAFHIADRSFDGIIRGNIFQAITTMPFIAFEDPTCTGWSVTDNKIYGSNGYLYEGDSAPALATNNRFFDAAAIPDGATNPEVASIYDWERTNAATPRLVLVIESRNVKDNGGTIIANLIRVKSDSGADLTVALSADRPGVSIPSTVTIPAGEVRAGFTITGNNVTGEQTLTLTASADGLLSDTEKVFVLDHDATPLNFGKGKWPVPVAGLPPNWRAASFGQATVVGTQTYAAETKTWNITGGGVAIAFNNPATAPSSYQSTLALSGRRFVYQTVDGDGEIRARISAARGEQQVGLMIADDEGTMTDFIMVEPNGRVLSSSNTSLKPHGQAVVQASPGTKAIPLWLRIKRTGFVFTIYKSTVDAPAAETDWTLLSTVDMYRDPSGTPEEPKDYKSPAVLDKRMHYGLFINSGSATGIAKATFTGVEISGTIIRTEQR